MKGEPGEHLTERDSIIHCCINEILSEQYADSRACCGKRSITVGTKVARLYTSSFPNPSIMDKSNWMIDYVSGIEEPYF